MPQVLLVVEVSATDLGSRIPTVIDKSFVFVQDDATFPFSLLFDPRPTEFLSNLVYESPASCTLTNFLVTKRQGR